MADHDRRVELEVLPHFFQIRHLRFDRDVFGLHTGRRFSPAPLVVVDQPVPVREPIHLRQEVRVIEIGAAVQDDHRPALTDLAREEFRSRHRDSRIVRGR